MRETRWIVLIKIRTHKQLGARWETYLKAEMACLFSLRSLHSSKFWVSSIICVRSSSLLSIFAATHFPAWIGIWHSKASFLFTLLNNLNSSTSFFFSYFQTAQGILSHFLLQSWRQIRLSNLWKCKQCGWTGEQASVRVLCASVKGGDEGCPSALWFRQWITNIMDEWALRLDDCDTGSGNTAHIQSIHDTTASAAHLKLVFFFPLFVFPAVIPRFLNAII